MTCNYNGSILIWGYLAKNMLMVITLIYFTQVFFSVMIPLEYDTCEVGRWQPTLFSFYAQVRTPPLSGVFEALLAGEIPPTGLIQLCFDQGLFLANTLSRFRLARYPPSASHRWTQIDHIVIEHWRRGSIEHCQLIWPTLVDRQCFGWGSLLFSPSLWSRQRETTRPTQLISVNNRRP